MREPLHKHLDSPTDESRISRMWNEVRRGRARRRVVSPTRAMGGAAVLALAAAAALWLWWPASDGQLALADGQDPGVLVATTEPRHVRFSDGSSLDLAPDTRVETLVNDDSRFSLLLTSGAARFEVTPGGPRRWLIEGGAASVEVVGTVFEVDRRGGGLRVDVERGVVVVRGEGVPNRVVRLTRGQHLEVSAPEMLATAPPQPSAPAIEALQAEPPAVQEPEPVSPPPASATAPRPATASRPAAASRPATAQGTRSASPAPAAPAPRGRVELAAPSSGVEGLLERAREAEARGEVHRQAALLRRVSEGDDPRAALAAYTLGRLEMDRLGHPEQARGALRRALDIGLPRRLAEQARARLRDLEAGRPALAPREIEAPGSLLPSTPPEP